MKIISLGPAYPLRGGIAKFNESLCRNLLTKGHELTMVSFKFLYPSFLFPGKSQFAIGSYPDNLKILPVLHSLNPFNWRRVALKIVSDQPDLLIIHHWMPFFAPAYGTLSRIVKKRLKGRIKIVLIAHNLIPHEGQIGAAFLSRYLLRKTDILLTLSSAVAEDAENLVKGVKKLTIAHPIYDIYGLKPERKEALIKLNLLGEPHYILFFGLIRKYKGLDILLKAMKWINSDIKLIVAGEFYDNQDYYNQIIREENIAERVILVNKFIPDDEVKNYFSLAELVVQPYRSATQSGITQIAYHFDVPMVVTNVGGLPEIVPDGICGFVVDVDPESMAKAVNRFFDQNLSESFILNVSNKKKEFSWDNFNEVLLQSLISG